MRGTFANVRLRNQLVPGSEGTWTVHLPDGEERTIFDVAERYRAEGVPTIVLAGKEYGSGSSRDWAAKGPNLLGVRAVIAESYERIHRSNLLMMGILPLQFLRRRDAASRSASPAARSSRSSGVDNGEAQRGDGAGGRARSSARASGSTRRASGSTFGTVASSRSSSGASSADPYAEAWERVAEAILESPGALPAYVRRAIARGEDPPELAPLLDKVRTHAYRIVDARRRGARRRRRARSGARRGARPRRAARRARGAEGDRMRLELQHDAETPSRSRAPGARRLRLGHLAARSATGRSSSAQPFSELLQEVMKGPSEWTEAERELFAAFVSLREQCPF